SRAGARRRSGRRRGGCRWTRRRSAAGWRPGTIDVRAGSASAIDSDLVRPGPGRLRLGVDLFLPCGDQRTQPSRDIGPDASKVVALADVLAKVEEQHVAGIDEHLPVALTYGAL